MLTLVYETTYNNKATNSPVGKGLEIQVPSQLQ